MDERDFSKTSDYLSSPEKWIEAVLELAGNLSSGRTTSEDHQQMMEEAVLLYVTQPWSRAGLMFFFMSTARWFLQTKRVERNDQTVEKLLDAAGEISDYHSPELVRGHFELMVMDYLSDDYRPADETEYFLLNVLLLSSTLRLTGVSWHKAAAKSGFLAQQVRDVLPHLPPS